jgi:hypothetical protein
VKSEELKVKSEEFNPFITISSLLLTNFAYLCTMKNRKRTDSNPPSKVTEPVSNYGNTTLSFFNSFEEMEQSEARQLAALSPVEHLQNATELIKRVYAKELSNMTLDKTIHFK